VYNNMVSPRYFGRRLEASDAQVEDLRRLRKQGMSLRKIDSHGHQPLAPPYRSDDHKPTGKASLLSLRRPELRHLPPRSWRR
jgi:hypothetical protein